MIDLSKNTNPYYPKRKMIKYLKQKIKKVCCYPEKYVSIENDKLQRIFGVDSSNVLVMPGTLEAMDFILRVENKKTLGYIKPTFWGITYAAEKNNYQIVEEPINQDLTYDLNAISDLSKRVDILYLCNNNNPTLSFVERDKLYKIIKNNPSCTFVVDETVLTFSHSFNDDTMIKYVNKLDNLNVLISCSKIFGVCGLRIGLLFTSAKKQQYYKNNVVTFLNNILANLFIKKYIHEFSNLSQSRNKIANNFNYFQYLVKKHLNYDIISNIICNNASFILAEINDNIDYDNLVQYLTEKGVKLFAVNHKYDGLEKKYLRISAGKKFEYKFLVKLLKKYNKLYGRS